MSTPTLTWQGCYGTLWKGILVNESYTHPAKFAPGLIQRILAHGIERGWWQKGDRIGDPFGGVATGGVVAQSMGLAWYGVELEEKFVDIGRRNIARSAHRCESLGLPVAVLTQGDSRTFCETVAGVVTSPPFTMAKGGGGGANREGYEGMQRPAGKHYQGEHGDRAEGNIELLPAGTINAVVTSPPYTAGGKRGTTQSEGAAFVSYGVAGSQIEGLPNGSVDAVVTSPPYGDAISPAAGGADTQHPDGRKRAMQGVGERYGASAGQIGSLRTGVVDGIVSSPPYSDTRLGITGPGSVQDENLRRGSYREEAYGGETAQIGNLAAGKVDAVVTLPPWEQNCEGGFSSNKLEAKSGLKAKRGNGASDKARLAQLERDSQKTYGESAGQIGREAGETYWAAMNAVWKSCFTAIKPGGVMAVVVKDYCKRGKRVPLCDDTLRLLEHIGFVAVERIHAMLVSETREDGLFGEIVTKTERKSFFRRVQEAKGSPRIDFECVLVVRKPYADKTTD